MEGDYTIKPTDLSGQAALVTGGSRGLGRAFAQALASAGAAVAVTARSSEGLAETVRLIEEQGGVASAFPADVMDSEAIHGVVAAVEKQLGSVDILVNNSGVMSPIGPDWEIDPDAWWRTFEINLHGPFLFARAMLPRMIERRRGRIINISSSSALASLGSGSAYAASKAALTNWTGSITLAAREFGISAFAYAPGFVRTAMTEYLAESPEVHRWFGDVFKKRFEAGSDTPLERAVEVLLFLASGQADALSGRHIEVWDDLADLVSRAEEIQRNDLYTLRRRK